MDSPGSQLIQPPHYETNPSFIYQSASHPFFLQGRKKIIVNPADYESYLTFQKAASKYSLDQDMAFWKERLRRMPKDEASKRKLAGLHAAKFRATGLVEELKISDSIYLELLKTTTTGHSGLLLGLAQNSITQHQFKQAAVYADSALAIGERKAAVMLVRVDIALELGHYLRAESILTEFANKKSFAHRIRQVKVKDQQGDLDSAILIMEAAHDRVKGNKDLYCWSLSNLGDMYGHAGRIEDAYQAYISVLQKILRMITPSKESPGLRYPTIKTLPKLNVLFIRLLHAVACRKHT